jgi:two-component system sensor histidine kinase UhpB
VGHTRLAAEAGKAPGRCRRGAGAGHDEGSKLTFAIEGERGKRTLLGDLLRVPLFYKILIANGFIVALVAFGCAVVARSAAADSATFAFVLAAGLALSVASNVVILRLALTPLRRLEETARRVRGGDLAARVEPSDLADRDFERLADTFNMMLDSANTYRRRLREVAARALDAQEEERKRIARELHDGIAQTLAALRLRLKVARAAEGDESAVALDRISAEIGAATEELRRIAQGLRPPALDMLGLAPAIESCARSITEATGMVVDTDMGAVAGLTRDAELALYRIVQEALSNAARHSGAASARVSLDLTDGVVTAVVSDTGRGFSVASEMSGGGGLGLFGMQERGAYVGGSVQIESEPGRGTQVRVAIPTVETARYA